MCVCGGGVCRASAVEESGFIPSQLETSEIPNKRAIVIDNMQDQKLREIKKGRKKLKRKKKRKKHVEKESCVSQVEIIFFGGFSLMSTDGRTDGPTDGQTLL